MKNKPKISIISLTSCQGCQFAILDLGPRFLALNKFFDFIDFTLIKDTDQRRSRRGSTQIISVNLHNNQRKSVLDLVFIEGTPTDEEQVRLLKEARRRSKFLVVLGNCAAMGGIQEIKNYHQPQKIIRQIYQNSKKISNSEIKEVKDFVQVDYTIPTCPVNAEEFLQLLYDYLVGKKFKIPERPVCYECQINQYECLLQKKEICFGPWTLGGCGAICLKEKQACWGCRGLLKETDKEKLIRTLEGATGQKKEEILKQAEVFGLRDEIESEDSSLDYSL